MSPQAEQPGELPTRGELLAAIAENRRDFLSFLERRVGHREVAEDVLQEAYARSLDKLPLGSEESAVAWFYRSSATPSSTTIAAAARASAPWPRSRESSRSRSSRTSTSATPSVAAWRSCPGR